jgi:hypothetical protein
MSGATHQGRLGGDLRLSGHPLDEMAHPNSTTPKRSKRVKVTTAETSNEPPQPSLLEKKMNKPLPAPVRLLRQENPTGPPGRTRSRGLDPFRRARLSRPWPIRD